jgi:hypothetical protein
MSRGAFSTINYFSRSDAGITSEPITMACWFYPVSLTNHMGLINIAAAAPGSGYSLSVRGATAGDPVGAMKDTSTTGIATASGPNGTVNTWFHAAGVFNFSNSRFAYFNGTAGSENTTNVVDPASAYQSIGVRKYNTGPTIDQSFQGYIAEVGIWTVALSGTEISSLASGIRPPQIQRANLVRYWRVNETSGNLIDLSGNAATMTEIGTVPNQSAMPTLKSIQALQQLYRRLRAG